MSTRRSLIRRCVGALACVVLQAAGPAVAADTDRAAVDEALTRWKAWGHSRPIVDTHIHFYQVTRPGGVVWPEVGSSLYRDVLSPEYKALARAHGIVASGVVEASPIVEDNQWILNLLGHDPFFPFFVGQLEIGSPSFIADLNRFSHDRRFVGIRGYLWSPAAGITLDAAQLRDLRELARRGMTLDIISRGTLNPKDRVQALCTAVPGLKIIIDHLGGAKGPPPVDPEWELSIRRLADVCPNLYMKFSSFYDMYAPGDVVFPSPTDLASYKPHFDVLFTAFGPNRLIWGSNWPVSDLHGTLADEIRLAEEYLAPFGEAVRDKVMFRNALMFYRRHVPREHGN
jgi:predicted TIM-barrel fold metal-dependent hydrolase